MAYDYEFLLRIQAPRPTVFEKLLRIEHLARWFCGWSRIEPKVGGKFQFGGETCLVLPEGRGWETTIDEGETLRRFGFTWPIAGAETRVAYDLEDAGSATVLRARHTGVPTADSTCGTFQDAWRICLGNLKSIAEGRSDSVRPDHSPVESATLRISNLVEAPAERLFAALTDPREVDAWTTGGMARGRPDWGEPGSSAFFFREGEGPAAPRGADPGRRLVLAWTRGHEDLRAGIQLEGKASGTAIYVTVEGYADGRRAEILRDRGRWADLLVGLKNHVEAGDAGFGNSYADQRRERASGRA